MQPSTNHRSDLTDRQRDILAYIAETVSTRGYPPSFREIGAQFGIKSPNGVKCNLVALERKGFIRRDSGARAITLTGPDARDVRIAEQSERLAAQERRISELEAEVRRLMERDAVCA